MAYTPSPGVIYTTAVPLTVVPVKYPFNWKERISSVPGSKGMARPLLVTTAELAVARAAVSPTPRNTITDPELMIRYCPPPAASPTIWTGVGAVAAAVKVLVLPRGTKALTPMKVILF
jgi:hypothetical protein